MAKNKGKNNSGDRKGATMDTGDMNNSQMQNKASDKKGGAQSKAGGRQEFK